MLFRVPITLYGTSVQEDEEADRQEKEQYDQDIFHLFLPLNVVDDPSDEVWQVNETSVSLSTIQYDFSFFTQDSNTMVFSALS